MRLRLVAGLGSAATATTCSWVAAQARAAGEKAVPFDARAGGPQSGFGVPDALLSGALDQVARALDVAAADPAEVGWFPLAGELATLTRLATALRGDADVLVVDAGTADDLLRLVGLVQQVGWLARRFLPVSARVGRALSRPPGGRLAGDLVEEAMLNVAAELAGLGALEDPQRCHAVLVGRAEGALPEQLTEAMLAFGVAGLGVAELQLRDLLPAAGEAPAWAVALVDEQQRAVAAVADLLGGRLRVRGWERSGEAEGVELSARAGDPVSADRRSGTGLPTGWPSMGGEPLVGGGGLRVHVGSDGCVAEVFLPFARPEQAQVRVVEDWLGVQAGSHQRFLPLPPVLTRCQLVAARIERPGTVSAVLRLSFTPDEQQWPAFGSGPRARPEGAGDAAGPAGAGS